MSETPPIPFDETEEVAFLRDTPVETILGNHLFVLLQLATLRLSESPVDFASAQLVIDTVAAMIDAAGDRLGQHVELYRSALSEVQQAYVRATLAARNS